MLQAVRRNQKRFPVDFMFPLAAQEVTVLRSQIVTSKTRERRGGRRYQVHAFTEQGVAMLSSVLRSETAVRVNIEIMRAFVRLRRAALVSAQVMVAPDQSVSPRIWCATTEGIQPPADLLSLGQRPLGPPLITSCTANPYSPPLRSSSLPPGAQHPSRRVSNPSTAPPVRPSTSNASPAWASASSTLEATRSSSRCMATSRRTGASRSPLPRSGWRA